MTSRDENGDSDEIADRTEPFYITENQIVDRDKIPEWYRDDLFDKPLTASRTLAIAMQAFEIESDSYVLYTQHRKAGRAWRVVYLVLGLGAVLVAALSGVSALMENTGFAAVLGFLAAFLGGAVGFLNPGEKASETGRTAGAALSVADRARMFREARLPNMLADGSGDRLVSDMLINADSVLASLTEDLSLVRQGEEPRYKTQELETFS